MTMASRYHNIIPFLAFLLICLSVLDCSAQVKTAGKQANNAKMLGAIENIRGLQFKKEFKTEIQKTEEFQEYVEESVIKQVGKGNKDVYVKALVKIGAFEKAFDLVETYVSLAGSQAAAHYDPEKETYFLLMPNMPSRFLEVTAAHEFCHALQDQHYDLEELLEGDLKEIRYNGDAASARQCLIEGDATYVMTIWMFMNQMGMSDMSQAENLASMSINMQGMLDLMAIVKLTRDNIGMLGEGAEDLVKAMEEMEHLPRFMVEGMYASYTYGGVMVDRLKKKDGWKAINHLYKNPPESTEQVLHPEKLLGDRDKPVKIDILSQLKKNLPRGWKMLEEDVMGELGIRIFLRIWRGKERRDPTVAEASAGWGGDRYYYFEDKKEKKDLLAWKTLWDTEKDAQEFEQAYRISLEKRFPSRKVIVPGKGGKAEGVESWEVEPGRFLKVIIDGKMVGIIDSTDKAVWGKMRIDEL